ncbi:MAG: SBBP repeat-containing protein [Phycisphaerae bacterium]|nr:SBBP repeat-containing protein [Phycisphaerae bacterium]
MTIAAWGSGRASAEIITEIIDATGGEGHVIDRPYGITVDAASNVYVTGESSHNAFKITPAGAITQIIDATGDGMVGLGDLPGEALHRPPSVQAAAKAAISPSVTPCGPQTNGKANGTPPTTASFLAQPSTIPGRGLLSTPVAPMAAKRP